MDDDWCGVGDCNRPECHRCFPVQSCTIHECCRLSTSNIKPWRADPSVVALIASVPDRMDTFLPKSVKSVFAQEHQVDLLIVVVDSKDDEFVQRVRALCEGLLKCAHQCKVLVLKNKRTPNVSGTGCWNTGIFEALRQVPDCFVAILDDDDTWKNDHVKKCLDRVETGVDWVVSGIERRSGAHISEQVPTQLSEAVFLRGNPGVQGSNLFVRITLLMRSGMFDENLNSMTDRDLCVRMLEQIEENSVEFTGTTTVCHEADPDRTRVTTSIHAKRLGIKKFLWKHHWRFKPEDLRHFFQRCATLFGVDGQKELEKLQLEISPLEQHAWPYSGVCPIWQPYIERLSVVPFPGARSPPLNGLFGVISSNMARLEPLLNDIADLPGRFEVVVFLNGDVERIDKKNVVWIDSTNPIVETIGKKYFSTIQSTTRNPEPPYPIGLSRTILQAYMATILSESANYEFAMVLDDDKRLPLGFLNVINSLDRSAIYVGSDVKTAPNALVNGLRGQLLDLWFSLVSSADMNPRSTTCYENPFDCYYDLSTNRFDHLEEPQRAQISAENMPLVPDRLLQGEPLFRYALPLNEEKTTKQRGGCMLLFKPNYNALAKPQYAPVLQTTNGEVCSRRSDSLWLSSVGVECKVHPGLFVFHDNTHDGIPEPSSARTKALAEAIGSALCRDKANRMQYLEDRILAMRCNNERIRGIIALLKRLEEPHLVRLVDYIEELFDKEKWESEVFEPLKKPDAFEVLRTWSPCRFLEEWDDASVVVRACQKLGYLKQPLCYVGQGKEGVVFKAEGGRCFKVFGSCTERLDKALNILCSKSIHHCKRESTDVPWIVSYDFVEGTAYEGLRGLEMQSLMRRMWKKKLTMTNLTPGNLLVTSSGRIEIVDLGHDWSELTDETHFKSMCRRAFLCFRYGQWAKENLMELKMLLNREQTGEFMAELTDFGTFYCGCKERPLPQLNDRLEKRRPPQTSESYYHSTKTTLLIKTCLMESLTLLADLRHILSAWKRAGTHFESTVLVVDRTRRRGLAREYHPVDEAAFNLVLTKVLNARLVERIVDFDGSEKSTKMHSEIQALNEKYFGVRNSMATHSANGAPHGALLFALEKIETPLVLQMDSDICLNIEGREDILGRAIAIFKDDTNAVTTLAVPIYVSNAEPSQELDPSIQDDDGVDHRFEIRCSILQMHRFRKMLPLRPTSQPRDQAFILEKGWYRLLDDEFRRQGMHSYRFVSNQGFFVHPPNIMKTDLHDYFLIKDRLTSADVVRSAQTSAVPAVEAWSKQSGFVDVQFQEANFFGERAEAIIFICCGRNLSYGRALRCLESLKNQAGSESVGVVVVDDSSDPEFCPASAIFEKARSLFPSRITCVKLHERMGSLPVKNHVIKRVCVNSLSVVVTLDLDDMLLSQAERSVVELIKDVFWDADGHPSKYLVALGGMVRHSKSKDYALELKNPRDSPSAGNVWTHIRCFRKYLFDAIGEENFRKGSRWIKHGTDWAFMIPIVEQAGADRVFQFTSKLYFYEESTAHTRAEKHRELAFTENYIRSLSRFPLFPSKGAVCQLPSSKVPKIGASAVLYSYNGTAIELLVVGSLRRAKNVPVRLHSCCFTGDVLGSERCDCREQLDRFFAVMAKSECAVLVYFRDHEGRGNGLPIKLKEYQAQDADPSANHNDLLLRAGGVIDNRSYAQGAQILRFFHDIESVELHTNNPRKVDDMLAVFGAQNVKVKTMLATRIQHNLKYLKEKVEHLGHDPRLLGPELIDHGEDSIRDFIAPESGQKPTMDVLRRLVRKMLSDKPFHNLGLINLSEGGACVDHNVFLATALGELGFDTVRLIGAHTRLYREASAQKIAILRGISVDTNHICLLVRLKAVDYLVDVGNGCPYFTPLCLGGMAQHADLQYRMVEDDDKYVVEHCRRQQSSEWRENYRFSPDCVLHGDDIQRITAAHTRDPCFGHMLHSLRLSRWELNDNHEATGVYLKDANAVHVSADGTKSQTSLNTASELTSFVESHFGSKFLQDLDNAVPILLLYLEINPNPKLSELLVQYSRRPRNETATFLITGSFNPIHDGHLRMIDLAKQIVGKNYKKVRVILSPSHDEHVVKKLGTTVAFQTRLHMVKLAAREGVEVSDWEGTLDGFVDSSTVAHHFVEAYPSSDVFYVVGQDFKDKGHCVPDKTFRFLVVPRDECSSSKIRIQLQRGADPRKLALPQTVAEYIAQHHLYTKAQGRAQHHLYSNAQGRDASYLVILGCPIVIALVALFVALANSHASGIVRLPPNFQL